MKTPLETHFVTDDFKQEFFFSKCRRVQWKDKQNDEQEMTQASFINMTYGWNQLSQIKGVNMIWNLVVLRIL